VHGHRMESTLPSLPDHQVRRTIPQEYLSSNPSTLGLHDGSAMVSGSIGWTTSGSWAIPRGKTLVYRVQGGPPVHLGIDSTFSRLVDGGRQLAFWDFRGGGRGWWIASLEASGTTVGDAKRLIPLGAAYDWHPDWSFVIYTNRKNEIWLIWTSTRKEQRVGTILPRLWAWDITSDAKEILWLEECNASKLMVVKNVFE
jgi:hypothetical protein